jgi:hypothetical protein
MDDSTVTMVHQQRIFVELENLRGRDLSMEVQNGWNVEVIVLDGTDSSVMVGGGTAGGAIERQRGSDTQLEMHSGGRRQEPQGSGGEASTSGTADDTAHAEITKREIRGPHCPFSFDAAGLDCWEWWLRRSASRCVCVDCYEWEQ